jgi:hypothetical protein
MGVCVWGSQSVGVSVRHVEDGEPVCIPNGTLNPMQYIGNRVPFGTHPVRFRIIHAFLDSNLSPWINFLQWGLFY